MAKASLKGTSPFVIYIDSQWAVNELRIINQSIYEMST
jgi:hypothetical protein